MAKPKFDTEDFQFSLSVDEDEGVATIYHFEVHEEIRRNGYGSVIIETLKRVAFQKNDISRLVVRMGGGDNAVQFLESNGFRVFNRREYSESSGDYTEGDFGVDAEYLKEWISEDY